MHAKRLLPLLAVLALAACQPPATTRPLPANGSPTTTLRGEAVYRERMAVPAGSRLDVQLLDTRAGAGAEAVVARTKVDVRGGPPFAFALPYDPSALRAGDRDGYSLHVALLGPDDTQLFASADRIPVVLGSDRPVQVPMVRAGAASAPTAAASPWDDARARGVGFRAVGNEPGWSVEVDKGTSPTMRVQLDYGQQQIEVPSTTPYADPQRGSAGFRGRSADGHTVDLQILRGGCTDSMSGARFEASAELHVDDRTLKGCGRFLFQ